MTRVQCCCLQAEKFQILAIIIVCYVTSLIKQTLLHLEQGCSKFMFNNFHAISSHWHDNLPVLFISADIVCNYCRIRTRRGDAETCGSAKPRILTRSSSSGTHFLTSISRGQSTDGLKTHLLMQALHVILLHLRTFVE